MVFARIWRIFSWPIRKLSKVLRFGARETAKASRTTAKTGSSYVAKKAAGELLEEEYREEPPSGIETVLFTQLPRPRLTERAASDLTLEQAATFAEQAQRFYRHQFPLFTRSDFFYEEVEEQYLNQTLGFDEESIDKRFLDVTTLFRQMLNGNTRRMLTYWLPFLFLAIFLPAAYLAQATAIVAFPQIASSVQRASVIYGLAAVIAFALIFLVYSWPFKVVQQRNLMNLDNYITSKFARINNNFQVAKRRALNVERDKRMVEREELKVEAGAWTLSYHWFAMRLFLCELALRNKLYQVRRNTTLYWVAGLGLTGLAVIIIFAVIAVNGADKIALGAFAAAAAVYLIGAGAIMRRTTGMLFQVLESNEWSRFHLVDLDVTIRDHVAEDKLQIVTFRDRNRME